MHLSTAGWIILIVFLVFVLSLNLSLIFALRRKPTGSNWMDQLKKTGSTFSHPWQDEDERFSELSSKVDDLRNKDHFESK